MCGFGRPRPQGLAFVERGGMQAHRPYGCCAAGMDIMAPRFVGILPGDFIGPAGAGPCPVRELARLPGCTNAMRLRHPSVIATTARVDAPNGCSRAQEFVVDGSSSWCAA